MTVLYIAFIVLALTSYLIFCCYLGIIIAVFCYREEMKGGNKDDNDSG